MVGKRVHYMQFRFHTPMRFRMRVTASTPRAIFHTNGSFNDNAYLFSKRLFIGIQLFA